MAHKRRAVLKAAGVAGATSLLAVGSSTAECEEVVDDERFSGGPLVGAAGPAGANEETTETFTTGAFSGSTLGDRRMDVTVSVEGPEGFNWIELDVEHERDGEWVLIGAKRDDAADGSIQVVDGVHHFQADAEAVVADDESYRITARATTDLDVVESYEIDVEFVAFDEDC